MKISFKKIIRSKSKSFSQIPVGKWFSFVTPNVTRAAAIKINEKEAIFLPEEIIISVNIDNPVFSVIVNNVEFSD